MKVYIVEALRTPVGRLYGALSSWRPDDLVVALLTELRRRRPWLEERLEALLLGCANQAGEDNRNIARLSALLAGLPPSVHALTVNTLCASGLDAVVEAARRIALGECHCCIAGGVESMSRSPWVEHRTTGERADSTIGWRFVHPELPPEYPPLSMPRTAELLARRLGIERAEQDEYALLSRLRYEQAQNEGLLAAECLPLRPHLERDEQHRLLSRETLSKLPPVEQQGRCITAGNSARLGDGAALTLLVSERLLHDLGLQPLACLSAWASAALHPNDMALTPLTAFDRLLERSGNRPEDFDRLEISEAFALQALLFARAYPQLAGRINPYGGELSIGKPLGSCGARLLVSLVHSLPPGGLGAAAVGAGLGLGTAVRVENRQ